ncbi:TPA: ParA family protein [Streptococcus suis]
MAIKIAFVNNKGGSAKTTSLVNFAGALSLKFPDKKILMVDGDGQGNVSRTFGISSKKISTTIYDIFMGNSKAIDAVINAHENIDLIPANDDMNYLEYDMMDLYNEKQKKDMFLFFKGLTMNGGVSDDVSFETFSKFIPSDLSITKSYFDMLNGKFDSLDEQYDFILFDTPPEIKAVTSSILGVSDYVIIPYEPDTYSLDGIINIVQRITKTTSSVNSGLRIAGLAPVKVKSNTKVHNAIMENVIEYCEAKNINHFKSAIPATVRFTQVVAVNALPNTLAEPTSKHSVAYVSLAEEALAFIEKDRKERGIE